MTLNIELLHHGSGTNDVSAYFACDEWPVLDLFEEQEFAEGDYGIEYREDLHVLRIDAPSVAELETIVRSEHWPKGLQQIFPVQD